MSATPTTPRQISFARLISTSIVVRLLVDIGVQMFNPFLPIFAAGLNTDLVVMGRLVGLRSAMGLLSPYFGAMADRTGYRRVMSMALLVMSAGMAVVGSSFGIPQAAVGMILLGLGIAGFVPTLQAYLGASLPYDKLARGMGMLEYSWALTGIVGLSLMGLLIAATNWRAPFFILSVGLLASFFLFRTLPSAREGKEPPTTSTATSDNANLWERICSFFRMETNAVSTYANIIAVALLFLGGMMLMVIHGAWFADQYGFGPRELGLVALLYGCFDLVASVSVSLFTDAFGKRRSVILGAVGATIGYLFIPILNYGAIPAVLITALTRGFFEFAIVANLPLLSGQSQTQRAKVMTMSSALTLLVLTFVNFTAPSLYERIGINGISIIAAIGTALSLLIVIVRVREIVPTANG